MSKNLKIGEEMETNIRQDNNEEVEIDAKQYNNKNYYFLQ